jgi:hypothetical protein
LREVPVIFRSVISRDNGTPWLATGMTSARWLTIPVRRVKIADLTATQPGIYFHGLDLEHHVGGDPHPHVINWAGHLYLEDGHHRTLRAALNGEHTITARVLTIEGEAPAWLTTPATTAVPHTPARTQPTHAAANGTAAKTERADDA